MKCMTIPKNDTDEWTKEDMQKFIEAVKNGKYDHFPVMYADWFEAGW